MFHRTCCTERACAALFVYPRRVLTNPAMAMLPIEVLSAAGVKEFGIDPLDVEQIEAFIEPALVAVGAKATPALGERG